MTNILNLEALTSARMETEIYPFARYENALVDPKSLLGTFPTEKFSAHSQRRILEAIGKKGSDAWYQHNVFTRPLLELGEKRPAEDASDLDHVWFELANELHSREYLEALSDLTGCDVRNLEFQAHFWRFKSGSFFQPHVDKPHKVVTHLMYLTDNWVESMGGCFHVLGSSDPADIRVEISPSLNNSIVLRRTDNAWHSVSPIPRTSNRERMLLQVWFWGK